jgi:hypothetical protein
MSIENNVKQVLADEENRAKDVNFQNLRDFYEQAKKDGIAAKPEYTLPQLDSIGRRLYAVQKASSEQR